MLSDLRPLLTEEIEHWTAATRNVFGTATKAGSTKHLARIAYGPGRKLGPASGEPMADAKAIVWLVNHDRPIAIGDTFELPDGDIMSAIRIERRRLVNDTLTKVYLT